MLLESTLLWSLLQQFRISQWSLGRIQQTATPWSLPSCLHPTLYASDSKSMLLLPDIPQGIADTLAYLQYYLGELSKQQNALENNINNTLTALSTQLQQLTQLVFNPNTSFPLAVSAPLLAPSQSLPPLPAPWSRACPKLSFPPDFNGEQNSGQAFLNSCTLYICLAIEQFSYEEEKVLWALTFFKGG